MATKEQCVRKKVLHEYFENKDLSHHAIGKMLGNANFMVSSIIKRFGERLNVDRKRRSVKICRQVNENDHKRVVGAFKRKPNASVRDVAKKLHVSKTFVQNTKP